MQRAVLKEEGYSPDPMAVDYLFRMRVCKHYEIPFYTYDRLDQLAVTEARLHFRAESKAYAARQRALAKPR
jgi:hypothetical protein